jgi:hypothetical protein
VACADPIATTDKIIPANSRSFFLNIRYNFYCGLKKRSEIQIVPDESVPTGAQQVRSVAFRNGSIRDMPASPRDVCFAPKADAAPFGIQDWLSPLRK